MVGIKPMKELSELPENDRHPWSDIMVDYSYDAGEWMRARHRLTELLRENGKQADESALRSYLACCAEAVGGSTPLPNLCSTLEDFYARYGMEGATDA